MNAVFVPQDKHVIDCPKCQSSDCQRVHRRSIERWLSHIIRIKAYRCGACNTRFINRA